MTTKKEMIEIIKAENPTLRVGDDDSGYIELSPTEYEAIIADWAEARLAKQEAKSKAEAERQIKIDAYNKLGLTEEEIEALLPTPKPFVKPII